jgi:hypothetical protein
MAAKRTERVQAGDAASVITILDKFRIQPLATT